MTTARPTAAASAAAAAATAAAAGERCGGDDAARRAGFAGRAARHPLRIMSLLAQTRRGDWVRNGHAALKPATLYRSPSFGDIFMLHDLLLLQYSLLHLGTSPFLLLTLDIFGLRTFVPRLVASLPRRPHAADPAESVRVPAGRGSGGGGGAPAAARRAAPSRRTARAPRHATSPSAPSARAGRRRRRAARRRAAGAGVVGGAAAAPRRVPPRAAARPMPRPRVDRNRVSIRRQLMHRLALAEHLTYSELTWPSRAASSTSRSLRPSSRDVADFVGAAPA